MPVEITYDPSIADPYEHEAASSGKPINM